MNRSFIWDVLVMTVLVLLLIGTTNKRAHSVDDYSAEYGYYRGQVDALEGDIRITLVKDSTSDSLVYVWSQSPWMDGRKPIFNPK